MTDIDDSTYVVDADCSITLGDDTNLSYDTMSTFRTNLSAAVSVPNTVITTATTGKGSLEVLDFLFHTMSSAGLTQTRCYSVPR